MEQSLLEVLDPHGSDKDNTDILSETDRFNYCWRNVSETITLNEHQMSFRVPEMDTFKGLKHYDFINKRSQADTIVPVEQTFREDNLETLKKTSQATCSSEHTWSNFRSAAKRVSGMNSHIKLKETISSDIYGKQETTHKRDNKPNLLPKILKICQNVTLSKIKEVSGIVKPEPFSQEIPPKRNKQTHASTDTEQTFRSAIICVHDATLTMVLQGASEAEVLYKLTRTTRKLQRQFEILIEKFQDVVTFSELRPKILRRIPSKYEQHFSNASTLEEIVALLNAISQWFFPELIEQIINEFGTETCTLALNQYKRKLKHYFQERMVLVEKPRKEHSDCEIFAMYIDDGWDEESLTVQCEKTCEKIMQIIHGPILEGQIKGTYKTPLLYIQLLV